MSKPSFASLRTRIQNLPLWMFAGVFGVTGLAVAFAEKAAPFLGFLVAVLILEPLYKVFPDLASGLGIVAFGATTLLWIPLNFLVGFMIMKLALNVSGKRMALAGLIMLVACNVFAVPELLARSPEVQFDTLHAIVPTGMVANLFGQFLAFSWCYLRSKRVNNIASAVL